MARDGGRLVGRDVELGQLRRLVDDGRGAVVVVTGEAGVGKTLLVDEVAAEVAGRGTRVVRGRSDERSDGRFGLWRRPARSLGIEMPDRDPSVATSEQSWELADLLRAALVAAAPVLLVLDDLHWADGSSLAVLEALVEERVPGVVVAATAREVVESPPGLAPVLRRADLVRLGPLDDEQIGRLVGSLTGTRPSADAVAALRERTGGNPLLVRESVRAGRGVLRSPAATDVLDAALDRAGADAAGLLGALALAGPAMPLAVLAAAVGLTPDMAQRRLDAAVDAEVLSDAAPGLRFRHDLLAEAARRRVPPAGRRRTHAALAAAWAGVEDPHGLARARHLVAALPTDAHAAEVTAVCTATAAGLGAARRAGDAVDLLEQALAGVRAAAGSAVDQARLGLALGEARWALGDATGALEAFEVAAAAAGAGGGADPDPTGVGGLELTATIEVARHRRHDPFTPDPVGRQRLAVLDAALGDGDSPLRVALLGRRAALAVQPPADPTAMARWTADAVAMAERLGDPGVLLGALHDRFLWLATPELFDERSRRAEEAVALAHRAGRPDLGLYGREWLFTACVERGDPAGAVRVLDELDALAAVVPSPGWRVSATVRRATLRAFRGDRDGALDLVDRLVELLQSTPAHEAFGMQIGPRAMISMLYQVVDPALPALAVRSRDAFARVPACFVQVAHASLEVMLGERDAARRWAQPWLERPEAAFESPHPLQTMALMAFTTVELGLVEHAEALARLMAPFHGRIVVDSGIEQVDAHLSALALLVGDRRRAVAHALDAVRSARALGSPPLEARALLRLAAAQEAADEPGAAAATMSLAEGVAEPIGLARRAPWASTPTRPVAPGASAGPAGPPADRVALRRTDGRWLLEVGDRTEALTATAGMDQLGRLLAAPGVEIAATDLAGLDRADAPPVDAGLGPALDARAKREYRRRITELRTEIDDADAMADLERAARARIEYDALLDELRRAVGLGGRDRPQGSGQERARINVTRSLRRAIATIERTAPELGAHLRVSVRTGHGCRYEPDPTTNLRWTIEGP